jgi:hypothetical protein
VSGYTLILQVIPGEGQEIAVYDGEREVTVIEHPDRGALARDIVPAEIFVNVPSSPAVCKTPTTRNMRRWTLKQRSSLRPT